MQSNNSELRDEITNLKKACDDKHTENEKLGNELEDSQAKISVLIAEGESATEEIANLRDTLEAREAELQNFKCDTTVTEINSKLRDSEKECRSLKQKEGKSEAAIADLRNQLATLQADYEGLLETNSSLRSDLLDVETLQAAKQELELAHAQCSAEKRQLVAMFEGVKASLEMGASNEMPFESELETVVARVADLRRERDVLAAHVQSSPVEDSKIDASSSDSPVEIEDGLTIPTVTINFHQNGQECDSVLDGHSSRKGLHELKEQLEQTVQAHHVTLKDLESLQEQHIQLQVEHTECQTLLSSACKELQDLFETMQNAPAEHVADSAGEHDDEVSQQLAVASNELQNALMLFDNRETTKHYKRDAEKVVSEMGVIEAKFLVSLHAHRSAPC